MNDIIDRFLSELINGYIIRLNKLTEYKRRSDRAIELSANVQTILSRLSAEDAENIYAYLDERMQISDIECKFIYIKGVTDCIKLLDWINRL